MSAIKDLYDLGKDLRENIKDRKTLELIMPVLDKIEEAERENLDLKKLQFDIERAHYEEVTNLKSAHAQEVSKLESKIHDLESQLKSKGESVVGSIPLNRG